MFPVFLISFREVIEASIIVATVIGILKKMKLNGYLHTVWAGVIGASILSFVLLFLASLAGVKIQEFYHGKTEEIIEGVLMIVSGVFITWAVFFLHAFFSIQKGKLLHKVKSSVESGKKTSLFILVFTAVFREGFEIVLFLSTIFLSAKPENIFPGFMLGIGAGLFVSFLFFNATYRLPIIYAFRMSSALLILFAAGLFARGMHEFMEAGLIPEFTSITLWFLPRTGTIAHDLIKALFGVTRSMDILPVLIYILYTVSITWYVFFRKPSLQTTSSHE